MSTALLAVLKAVVKDGSTPVVSRPAVQPLALAQYSAGHFLVEYVNEDGSPHSLVYDTPLHAVRRHPTDADAVISLQGTVLAVDRDGNPAENWARFDLIPGHWVGVDPKMYGHEGVLLVGGDPDDRVPVIPHSPWTTTPADVHPGDNIQSVDPQAPLGQGLPGNPRLGSTAVKTSAYTAAFNDRVLVDPTAGDFDVTLPLASSRVNGSADTIQIKNVSDSPNAVSLVLQGGDLVDGLETFFLAAREHLTLVAYEDGQWGIV